MKNRHFLIAWLVVLSGCMHMGLSKKEQKAKLLLQLSLDEYNQHNYPKAIESARLSLQEEPNAPEAYNHLALIYLETKQYKQSEEYFGKALKLKPDYADVYNNLGVLYNREEKYDLAIPQFEKALSFDTYSTPENAYTNMGFSYYKLGKLSQAIEMHQKALNLSPLFCLAAKNLGDSYAKARKYLLASEYFKKALTHCSLYEEAQYKLGLVLMKLGQKPYAKIQLEKLIERHKTGPYVERAQVVLKYLNK